ncbi:Bug family tripartite tricarboxylate transporter substrate binding protein [Bordetella genomosp. 13]|uniref:Bug family tripartite tricarboxylate transporter substrate binding protein n=1 Tax=Bordetella genomosp. 13 TaxID=463040 RepID=UPI001642D842|nr:tripartite tricarboxylate transporter substrate binding protein [Bordetella genomosp. 13]
MSRRSFLAGSLGVMLAGAGARARAQGWPANPIKLIVGYPPGGPVDNIARLTMPFVGKILGQSIVIENKPGAAGGMGVASTLRADPDGYTFGIGVLGLFAISPHIAEPMFKLEDVNYVTMLTRSPHVFVVNPERGIADLPAFVAAARKTPGKLNYGSPGYGSTTHLDVELLLQAAKIDVLHVPYKGGSAAMNALLGDEVQMLSVEISAALPLQQKVRIAAIMADKRSPLLPDVPTTVELGYPSVIASSMYGVIAPPKTPDAIMAKFRAAVHQALAMPEVRDQLLRQGQAPSPSTAEEYRKLMADESARWAGIIKTRGIKVS